MSVSPITAILNPLGHLASSMSSAPIESSSKYTYTAMPLISFVSQLGWKLPLSKMVRPSLNDYATLLIYVLRDNTTGVTAA